MTVRPKQPSNLRKRDPRGIRTPVTGLRTRRTRPLYDGTEAADSVQRLKLDGRSHHPGPLVPGFDRKAPAVRRLDHPLHLPAVRRRIVRPPPEDVPLHVPALELPGLHLRLPANDPRAVRQREL